MKYDYDINLDADNSLSHILRRIKPGSKVLEFGPAKGYMTQILTEQMNCSVYCVEIDEEAAQYAAQYAQKIIVGDLDTMEWLGVLSEYAPYDYIIYADVLEHLKFPEKVLKASVELLSDNGTVLTSIPNMAHSSVLLDLLQGNFSYRSVGLLDNTHLRFYTKKSIVQLLEDCGLVPIEWMSTMMLPEQTEISTNYEYVPEFIANYISERENAHVYQFVTAAQKATSNRTPSYTVVPGKWEYSHFMQLFWGEHYVEERSVKVGIDSHRGHKVYRVHLPKEALGRMVRIDPTNFPAVINLDKIIMLDLDNNVLREWIGTSLQESLVCMNQINLVEAHPERSQFTWLADGQDPHWNLFLPSVSHNDIVLELHMHTLQVDALLIQSLSRAYVDFKAEKERALLVISDLESINNQLLLEQAENQKTVDKLKASVALQGERLERIFQSKFWKITRWLRPSLNKVLKQYDDRKGE